MKHFSHINDFTKEELLEAVRRSRIFSEKKDFTNVAPGLIVGLGFFQESTRTVSGFQAASIRLGGGWLGVASPAGSYVNAGEESVEDTLDSLAMSVDVLAVRHKNFDLSAYAKKATVPVINGMCGGDEHTQGSITLLHSLADGLGSLENRRFGIYGMTKSSRPIKGFMRVLSKFGATFIEDPVIPEFQTPAYLRQEVEAAGGKIIEAKLDDFIGDVEVLFVAEGLPQGGEDEALVKKYNEKVRIFGKEELAKLRSDAFFYHVMPATLTDGRSTVDKAAVDQDKRGMTYTMLRQMTTMNMALITQLLDIPVK